MSVQAVPYYVWDIETYLRCFLFVGKMEGVNHINVFEISSRKNQKQELLGHLNMLQNSGVVMCGFNSLGFDWPIVNQLIVNPHTFNEQRAYLLGQDIIHSQGYGNAGNHNVRMSDRFIPQVDLVKVNHFDNPSKRTSLKTLQFNMRSESVEDLPFAPDRNLTSDEMDLLIKYCIHDVTETEKFLGKCKHLIGLRQELLDTGVLYGDVLNYSDVKIGAEYLIKKIGRTKCFIKGSEPKQSLRSSVVFKDIILPKINFKTEEFNVVLDWFKKGIIYPTGETEKPKLETTLAGIQFHFGAGGVHASVENRKFESNETYVIKDIDVGAMYPSVAVANSFAPEHLGEDFSVSYKQLGRDRSQYPKGTTMNAVLKLANNGTYGNSNNPYSCFYDPKFTFSITVNGQLQILQLVEHLSAIPGLQIIQANTDGITAYMPRDVEPFFNFWCREWENDTGLKLEENEYNGMWIRDVNSYFVITKDGKIKAKGAYWFPREDKDYDGNWSKDFSNMAVQKATEPVLTHGCRPEDTLRCLSDPFDFMARYKTPSGAKVYIGDKEMPKTVRYYISISGEPMRKVSQPKGVIGSYKRKNGLTDGEYRKILATLPEGTWDARIHTKNKSKYAEVTTGVESGWLVKECNVASKFNWSDVDWSYYAEEVNKLVAFQ